MKNENNNIDALQSDLSWLDEFAEAEDAVDISGPATKKSRKSGQPARIMEIGGQLLTLERMPSANSIAGAKASSRKLKGVKKSESHVAAIRAAAALRRGIPSGRKGIPHSEIHKQRIGDGNRGVSRKTAWQGRKHREDTKEKLRQFNLNRDPSSYTYSTEKKAQISNSISAGKKGKPRSPEMLEQMARQRAMNFKTPLGVFRNRSQAEKAYFELGHSKQDFKKFCKFQSDNFYFTYESLSY
jgi:hypothetical protein